MLMANLRPLFHIVPYGQPPQLHKRQGRFDGLDFIVRKSVGLMVALIHRSKFVDPSLDWWTGGWEERGTVAIELDDGRI